MGSSAGGVTEPLPDPFVDELLPDEPLLEGEPFVDDPGVEDPDVEDPDVEDPDVDEPDVPVDDASAGELAAAGSVGGTLLFPPLVSEGVVLELLEEVSDGVSGGVEEADDSTPPAACVGEAAVSLAAGEDELVDAAAGSPVVVDAEPSVGLVSPLAAASAGLSSGFAPSAAPSAGLASSVLAASEVAEPEVAASVAAAAGSVLASSGLASLAATGASVDCGDGSLAAAGAAEAGVSPFSLDRSVAMISSIFLKASSATAVPSTLPSSSDTLDVSCWTCWVAASRASCTASSCRTASLRLAIIQPAIPRHASETTANALLLIPSNIRLHSSRATRRAPPAPGLWTGRGHFVGRKSKRTAAVGEHLS